MRESIIREIGRAGDLVVRAIVTNRESDETRVPLVEIEDLSTGDRLLLPWGRAELLGTFLGGQAMSDEEGFSVDDRLSVGVSDDLGAITFVADDPREGKITISRGEITAISDLLRDAASAVSMIEDLDAK
jgi:hypothetical protein